MNRDVDRSAAFDLVLMDNGKPSIQRQADHVRGQTEMAEQALQEEVDAPPSGLIHITDQRTYM